MRYVNFFVLIAASLALFACGSNSTPAPAGTVTGTATIKLNGGNGGTASGGDSGWMEIDAYSDVKLTRGGSIDTSFAVPSYPQSFGATPATISANTTVAFVNISTGTLQTTVKPDSGTLFTTNQSWQLYRSTGASTDPDVITGLTVNSGATLTFTNVPYGYVWTDNGISINGTVNMATEGSNIDLESGGTFVVGPAGKVTAAATTSGTSGGYVYLYGEVVVNQGSVDSSGAAGGGSAGWAELEADSFVYNTGTILARGGNNGAGSGGNSGGIYLYGDYASVYNSGALDASGGNGTTGGGSAGDIDIEAAESSDMARLLVGGTLTANGGNATTGGNGGSAADIYLYNYGGGDIWVSAPVTAIGGTGTGAGSVGGNGAYMETYWDYNYDYGYGEQGNVGTIKLAGSIDLSGGAGAASGGTGGDLYISANDYADEVYPASPTVELLGYSAIALNGGSGTIGGSSSSFDIYTEDAWTGQGNTAVPVGAITSEVPVSAKGGDGSLESGGSGGSGGYIDWEAEGEFYVGTTVLTNSGTIDISGGAGDAGGSAGSVYFYGHDKLTNSAAITATGGKGTTTGGSGANYVEFYATQDIASSGNVTATGGTGATGGGGGYIDFEAGGHVTNSGALLANGGASTDSAAGNGGNGNEIYLLSESAATTNTGSLKVTKGAGSATNSATNGTIYFDFANVTPTSGMI